MTPTTTKLGPFPVGLNNRTEEFAVPSSAVRDVLNVDISLDGRLRRRAGYKRLIAGAHVGSLHSGGDRAFFVDSGVFYEWFPDGSKNQLYSNLTAQRMAFVAVPGRGLAFTDGQVLKRLVGTIVMPFAIAPPTRGPACAVIPGALAAGMYQISLSFFNAAGEESGILGTQDVAVGANGGIRVTLSHPIEPESVSIGVYCSALNSEDVYLIDTVPATQATYDITVPPVLGRDPLASYVIPLPPGDLLAFYNGRVYSHANGLISFTEPWSGQHDPINNTFRFPTPVSIMHATTQGMWIVADQTYFLSNDGDDAQLREVNKVRAVPGTLIELPDSKDVMWFTSRGFVTATDDGKLDFMQQDNVAFYDMVDGAALLREQDGMRQSLASVRQPGVSVGAASTWFEATISSGEVRNDF